MMETLVSNSQGSKGSIFYFKTTNSATSRLKPPNSLSRYCSSSGSSLSTLFASSCLPSKSRLPIAVRSVESVSRDQLPLKLYLDKTTRKARGASLKLKQPITTEILETKRHVMDQKPL
ncbi:uncharacterized protein LOC143247191 isoform X1 [Tachypleus tridentatus]|uniref:uncharacterized protein LOC143247191 isoform X1 n=1 Tax=Tachypleus tridentatus TaxID=6853 RepID=UPI003FD070FF